MPEMTIRPATAADSPRLTELARRAKASSGYPAEWLRIWNDELTLPVEYLAEHDTFVAEVGGEIAGVCVLEDHGTSWMLEHMWIDPGLQRGGIGRALVTAALARASARRPGPVKLIADPFAESFYARLGARRIDDVPAPMPGAPERVLPLMEFVV